MDKEIMLPSGNVITSEDYSYIERMIAKDIFRDAIERMVEDYNDWHPSAQIDRYDQRVADLTDDIFGNENIADIAYATIYYGQYTEGAVEAFEEVFGVKFYGN